ncbi:hypothetical protein KI387_010603, partial [Taxus chinensis]
IEFNLEHGWHTTIPRSEANNYMEIYGADNSRANKKIFRKKVLELAKLDFNNDIISFK